MIDENGVSAFNNLIIVNKRTGKAFYAGGEGEFSTQVSRTDTLMIGAIGYKTFTHPIIARPDQKEIHDTIVLVPLSFDLNTVNVFGKRDLEEIIDELGDLNFNEADYMVSGIDAYQSPITFLYQSLSRRAQQERLAKELMVEARRKEVLKELFGKYVDAGIIHLDEHEFDEFIEFCDVPERVVKTYTQYEFIMYIKSKYRAYRRIKDF